MFDWLDDADANYGRTDRRNITKIYNQVIEAIDQADASVIEFTVPNFSSSHQINYSLLKKKPTLVMRLKKDNPLFYQSYLEAIQSPFLQIKDYTKFTYKEVLDEFIGYSRMEQGQQRYNIVLDKAQKYYLDWASTEYNKSRSQMIRELIDHEKAKDERYKKYMNIKK
jgi:hypothetical protein